jgi:hypothetical protein
MLLSAPLSATRGLAVQSFHCGTNNHDRVRQGQARQAPGTKRPFTSPLGRTEACEEAGLAARGSSGWQEAMKGVTYFLLEGSSLLLSVVAIVLVKPRFPMAANEEQELYHLNTILIY